MNPMQALRSVGRFARFCAQFFREGLTRRPPEGEVFREAYNIGVRSLPILLIISAFVGTNLTLQGHHAFEPIGGQNLVGMFVGLAGVRELAPIIAASMVAAKAGTEMASQVAVMRSREEIDALEVMGINSRWYLIAPKFLGILLVMPVLTTLAIYGMLASAYAVAVYQLGLNGSEFVAFIFDVTETRDLLIGNIKALFFGAVICLICCYNGYNSEPGPKGVGSATNRAVVTAAVACVLLNYLISEIAYA
ncbi:MAG: ABC transporter permease [Myxococcota bacterium]|nr:ABC transporter permease [Myxococcota bacterium]